MTNTLHRFRPASSFHDDFVIFAIPSKGRNEEGSLAKLKQFLELALAHRPVNLGDALNGGALRPAKLTPLAHWARVQQPDFRAVIDELQRAKPASAKGRYLKKISVSSTMGPGVKVDTNRLRPEV